MNDRDLLRALPVQRIQPVGYWPFWLGTLRDVSGNGNHGTPSELFWSQVGAVDGLRPTTVDGQLDVAYDASLAFAQFTMVFHSRSGFRPTAANQLYINRGAANYQITFRSDRIRVRCNSSNSDYSVDYTGVKTVAIVLAPAVAPDIYFDGVFSGVGNAVVTPDTTTQALDLMGATTGNVDTETQAIIFYDEPLTAAEILGLHDYLLAVGTPRRQWPGAGLVLPGRERNEITATPAAAWTPANNPLITDIAEGIRIAYVDTANPEAKQTVLESGAPYILTAEARGDGVGGVPLALAQSATVFSGSSSNEWERLAPTFVSAGTLLRLRNQSSSGYSEWRRIKLWRIPTVYEALTGDPLYLDNLQTAQVTLADQDSGQLSNTGYLIKSGTWSLDEDAASGERYIRCVAAGILHRRNLSAYGTWEYKVRKAGDSNLYLTFVASLKNVITKFGQDAYTLLLNSSERVWLQRSSSGTTSTLHYTLPGYFAHDTLYTFRVTRSEAGEFTTYVKGGAFAAWTLVDTTGGSGDNPTTDTNITESLYEVLDLDAGDRVYLATHYAGVIDPTQELDA